MKLARRCLSLLCLLDSSSSVLGVQAVVTGVWAAATVFFSSFGYTTMRTGAHMADTGTEHNIELIVGVSRPQLTPDVRRRACSTRIDAMLKCLMQTLPITIVLHI